MLLKKKERLAIQNHIIFRKKQFFNKKITIFRQRDSRVKT
jgi:hypothetical protein